jgi:YfiH family protein
MENAGWILQSKNDCEYFELTNESCRMVFTVGHDQHRCMKIFSPVFLKQLHSATIINLDENDSRVGDGLLTHDPNRVLGLKIADCLPVYMYNDKAMCIIHCGWRGILQGIAKSARDILGSYSYALGACIEPECYEVKYDVISQFGQTYPAAINNHDGRYFFDLKKAVIQDLGESSLIASLDLCTMCHPEYFFSFRRGDRKKRNYAIISRR